MKDRHTGAGREGSGRVSVYRATGVTYCYTLECNFNTGRVWSRKFTFYEIYEEMLCEILRTGTVVYHTKSYCWRNFFLFEKVLLRHFIEFSRSKPNLHYFFVLFFCCFVFGAKSAGILRNKAKISYVSRNVIFLCLCHDHPDDRSSDERRASGLT